jgi:hypothetical protein
VFGNRFHGGPHRVLYFWHYAANRGLTLLTNLLTGLNVTDMEVGYKVFRRDVPRRLALTSDRFGFEPEVTVKVAKLGCRVYEVPIRYYGRTCQESKKITWRDGAGPRRRQRRPQRAGRMRTTSMFACAARTRSSPPGRETQRGRGCALAALGQSIPCRRSSRIPKRLS